MLLLCGCNPAAQKVRLQLETDTAAERPVIAPYVGHSYYLIGVGATMICDRPDFYYQLEKEPDGTVCAYAKGKFTIDSYAGVFYLVHGAEQIRVHATFASGAAGYVGFNLAEPLSAAFADHDTTYDPVSYPVFLIHLPLKEAARRLKLPGVVWNMTEAQVLVGAWGTPVTVKTAPPCRVAIPQRYEDRPCDHHPETWFYPENAQLDFWDGKVRQIIRK